MPHIIVEYSSTLEDQIDVPVMLEGMHDVLADAGVEKGRIKTRGISLTHNIVGEKGVSGQMVHVTLLLLEGRDVETKKAYATPIHDIAKAKAPQDCAITLEVRDMVSETYFL